MSTPARILSENEIKRINDEALAAVERGQQTLDRSRELGDKVGFTRKQVEHALGTLDPASQAWIHKAVGIGVTHIAARPHGTSPARARKAHTLV